MTIKPKDLYEETKEMAAANTRFILFGHSASAFAKAVAPAKDVYFCFANV
jgi:hypothetical protein